MLEVLIGFSLAILFLVPLVREPLKHYQTEVASLERLEKERLADWTFTEIQEMLLKNEIPWKELPELNKTLERRELPPAVIHLPGSSPKKVPRWFALHCHGQKEGPKGELYKMLHIYIYFADTTRGNAKYRLIVQKLPVA